MTAHHHTDVDSGQGSVVQIGANESLRDEPCGRGKTRRVVAADQVIVDGLRHMDAAQRVACLLRFEADDAHGVG